MPHIIVEGPDGSGKTTLVQDILDAFGSVTKHERACTSLGGPIDELDVWTMRTTARIIKHEESHTYLFDRIPFVSDSVYKTALERPLSRGFDSTEWWERYASPWFSRSLLVVCLPPYENVETNVRASENMPGVAENTARIYAGYDALSQSGVLAGPGRHRVWRGPRLTYDYTDKTAYWRLMTVIAKMTGLEMN